MKAGVEHREKLNRIWSLLIKKSREEMTRLEMDSAGHE